MNIDLTTVQRNALVKYYDHKRLTKLGLSRALKVDRAVAETAIAQLTQMGLLTFCETNASERELTNTGLEYLVFNRMVPAHAKLPEKRASKGKTEAEAVTSMASAETVALMAVDPETKADTCKKESFDQLVRKGLERLNRQIGYVPVVVENKKLKVSTLSNLAETLDRFDVSLATIIRDVANDLHQLPEVSHG